MRAFSFLGTEKMNDLMQIAEHVPPDVAGYIGLAAAVLVLFQRGYRALLDRYEKRFDQLESSHAAMAQDMAKKDATIADLVQQVATLRVELAEARGRESRCEERVEAMKDRIAQLERKLSLLGGEISEPIQT
jgi:septal ring factor EnvC (AmiA/AmiB activator)